MEISLAFRKLLYQKRQTQQIKLRDTSKVFLNYDNIKLSTYVEVVNTNNFKLVCIEGNASTEECLEAFDLIVKRNAEENRSLEYSSTITSYFILGTLISKQLSIKIALYKLMLSGIDSKLIAFLKDEGYNISIKNHTEFVESINRSFKILVNLERKIARQAQEIELSSGNTKQLNVNDLVADLSMNLNMNIPMDITLAMFNAYIKQLKKRAPKKKTNGRVK